MKKKDRERGRQRNKVLISIKFLSNFPIISLDKFLARNNEIPNRHINHGDRIYITPLTRAGREIDGVLCVCEYV